MGYKQDGVLAQTDLEGMIPPPERLEKGGCVIVECVDRIPCNPCVDACRHGSITIDGGIKELPEVDFDLCDGCGVCISACPGLAIFMVRYVPGTGLAEVSIPYEFTPLPEKGDRVIAMNRAGEEIGEATVRRVAGTARQNRTAIVALEVDRSVAMEVRHFRRTILHTQSPARDG